MDEMTLTLNSPITEEQYDAIMDVDFDHTNKIWFNTKHGKKVEFVKVPQWIPCSEHQPTEDGEYITTVETCEGMFATSNNWRQDKQEWGFWTSDERFHEGWVRTRNNIAWMPLPEPYKGGEQKTAPVGMYKSFRCDGCKYYNRTALEYPCKNCARNHGDYFEKGESDE